MLHPRGRLLRRTSQRKAKGFSSCSFVSSRRWARWPRQPRRWRSPLRPRPRRRRSARSRSRSPASTSPTPPTPRGSTAAFAPRPKSSAGRMSRMDMRSHQRDHGLPEERPGARQCRRAAGAAGRRRQQDRRAHRQMRIGRIPDALSGVRLPAVVAPVSDRQSPLRCGDRAGRPSAPRRRRGRHTSGRSRRGGGR